jgi:hypothetical protein
MTPMLPTTELLKSKNCWKGQNDCTNTSGTSGTVPYLSSVFAIQVGVTQDQWYGSGVIYSRLGHQKTFICSFIFENAESAPNIPYGSR